MPKERKEWTEERRMIPREERQKIAKELEMSSYPRKRFGLTERLFLVTVYDENTEFWPAMEMLADISKEFPVKPI